MKKYKNLKINVVQHTQDCITTSSTVDEEKNARDDVKGFDDLFKAD